MVFVFEWSTLAPGLAGSSGGDPFTQAKDGSINGPLLADVPASVYRRLKEYERRLLTVCEAGWPERSIAKVTVALRINNHDARDTI